MNRKKKVSLKILRNDELTPSSFSEEELNLARTVKEGLSSILKLLEPDHDEEDAANRGPNK